MLEIILEKYVLFVLMGILTVIGIVSKGIVNVTLKKLVRAAGNMSKSNHPLMRLVRAKFEHASMVSDKVENVRVFVDKYLYEYKVLGMKLHGWRRLEKVAAGLCLLAGAAGALLEYNVNGMSDMVLKTGATGAGLAILIYLVHLTTDENYRMEAVQNYMVDYLENVCRHRYEKTYQRELKVLAQENGQMGAVGFGAMPDEQAEAKKELQEEREQKTAGENYAQSRVEVTPSGHRQRTYGAADENVAARGREYETMQAEESVKSYEPARNRGQETDCRTGDGSGAAGRMYAMETEKGDKKPEPSDAVEIPGQIPEPEVPRPIPQQSPQVLAKAKDKKSRRERVEEEIDKDVVIRRILEEFMA